MSEDNELEKAEEEYIEKTPVADIVSEEIEAVVEGPAAAPEGYKGRPDRSFKKSDSGKYPKFRRKVCRFCQEKDLKINYRDAALMERFITDRGKILPRRSTGTCAKHQRDVAIAVKRARILALIPFVEK